MNSNDDNNDVDDKLSRQTASVPVVSVSLPTPTPGEDVVVTEAPLQVQVQGSNVAVLMRTPGDDDVLTLGFLWSEGWIRSIDDVRSVRHCDTVDDDPTADWDDDDHVMQVVLHDDSALQKRRQRATVSSSSCGMCGKALLDEVASQCAPVPMTSTQVPVGGLADAVQQMQAAQRVHQKTGACHAAAAFAVDNDELALEALYEDVGRHNACDKLLGHTLRHPSSSSTSVWVLSSRIAYELVHKAAVAQVAVLAGVSAPTSLAVRLADRMGITLVGFVRGTRANVYTHPNRLGLTPAPPVEIDA